MLNKKITSGLFAILVGIGVSVAGTNAANAGNIDIQLGVQGPNGSIYVSGGHKKHRKHKRHLDHYAYHDHHVCRPGRAVHKAERRGLRHVRIKRIGDRFVVVKGRRHGRSIKIAFYRDTHRCEVAWVKRGHRKHDYGYYGDIRHYERGYGRVYRY